MPEFRFRRKKQQNRRKTVHDIDEAAKEIEAAKKLEPSKPEKRGSIGSSHLPPQEMGVAEQDMGVAPPIPPKVNRSSLVQEREKFFELLRSKYPEQASNLEMMTNGDQDVKVCVCECACGGLYLLHACTCTCMQVRIYLVHH